MAVPYSENVTPLVRPTHADSPVVRRIEASDLEAALRLGWEDFMAVPSHAIMLCLIYPVRRADLESVEPTMRVLSANAELQKQNSDWQANRGNFIAELDTPGSDAQAEKWQRGYYRGMMPSGDGPVEQHRTRLRLKPFEKA